MVLHAALSFEDVVVAAADTDVLILMNYAYSEWLNRNRFCDARIANVLIIKQFPRILVNDMPWHY